MKFNHLPQISTSSRGNQKILPNQFNLLKPGTSWTDFVRLVYVFFWSRPLVSSGLSVSQQVQKRLKLSAYEAQHSKRAQTDGRWSPTLSSRDSRPNHSPHILSWNELPWGSKLNPKSPTKIHLALSQTSLLTDNHCIIPTKRLQLEVHPKSASHTTFHFLTWIPRTFFNYQDTIWSIKCQINLSFPLLSPWRSLLHLCFCGNMAVITIGGLKFQVSPLFIEPMKLPR